MLKENLLYLITGTETPRFVSEREMCVIDKCLTLINDREEEILLKNKLISEKINTISTHLETIANLKHDIKELSDYIRSLND